MQSIHSSMYLDMINKEREEVVSRGQQIQYIQAQRGSQVRFHALRISVSQILISVADRIGPGDSPVMATDFYDDTELVRLAR